MPHVVEDLPEPIILQALNTGRLEPLGSAGVPSAILKKSRNGPVYVTKEGENPGLDDDEHDMVFHGGPDKALHQYCSNHYPWWREKYKTDPQAAERFQPGAFGENLVTEGWNEDSICIGDIVRIGPAETFPATGGRNGVLAQVSIPRQPCFKLNQRFGIKAFAARTHENNKTGWYYRILEDGWIEAGNELRLLDRKNPKWTISKMHHQIHRDAKNRAELEEGLAIPEMGSEAKGYLERNIAKIEKEEAAKLKPPESWKKFKVIKKNKETNRVLALTLEQVDKKAPLDIDVGTFARIKLGNGLIRPYSIASADEASCILTLGVALEPTSRGGSKYIHENVQLGDEIQVGNIVTSVPRVPDASNRIFIAGGIGITAYTYFMRFCDDVNYGYELHYAVRSDQDMAFKSTVDALKGRIHIYNSAAGTRLDVRDILQNRRWNSHVYACGPSKLMDAVRAAAADLNIPDEEIHYEAFEAVLGGDPFEVTVEGTGKTHRVGEEETLLEVLRKAGLDVQSSCEVGTCGTCRVGIVDGEVEHRGTGLQAGEKTKFMLSCCSRGKGKITVDVEE